MSDDLETIERIYLRRAMERNAQCEEAPPVTEYQVAFWFYEPTKKSAPCDVVYVLEGEWADLVYAEARDRALLEFGREPVFGNMDFSEPV